jgi:hypothetical protein
MDAAANAADEVVGSSGVDRRFDTQARKEPLGFD